ncbi:Mce protein [Mycolicibacterium sphagni]|uniref:Mce protein n=1 Tax=Mycolicibacterium sphagni TaxID=1786 RepID=A0A255DX18_9MYCO|nr:Mce protein [Mycolicibacterium sphagni]OYN80283.1 Mce protein [Mycolicibacterium sphagni]
MADEQAPSEDEAATPDEAETGVEETEPAPKPARSHVRLALIAGIVVVVALGGLAGWLGYRAYDARKTDQLQDLIVGVGRQGAINLTTIDAAEADKDVQRILDSATDQFYDDFAKRSQPFIEVVKQAQSKSVGTVTEAGLESMSGEEGHVLVAVTVVTSNRGAQNQPPRSWRMRLTVKKTGADEAKVSKVEFVP